MTYLALVSAREGRRTGVAILAGVALGPAAIGVLAAFGVAQLIAASDLAYDLLRWADIFYLLYLTWDGWRGEGDLARTPGARPTGAFSCAG